MVLSYYTLGLLLCWLVCFNSYQISRSKLSTFRNKHKLTKLCFSSDIKDNSLLFQDFALSIHKQLFESLRSVSFTNQHLPSELITKQKLQTTCHPGFPLSLTCNHFKTSGFLGSIECWKANPLFSWISKSTLFPDPEQTNPQTTPSIVDLKYFTESNYDLPYFSLVLKHLPEAQKIRIDIDFPCKIDLLNNSMSVYDKYYQKIDVFHHQQLISNPKIVMISQQTNGLSRIVSSPIAISFQINEQEIEELKLILQFYIDHYLHSFNQIQRIEPLTREINLKHLLFDFIKYQYANDLGLEFAPKAEDIAASILGPFN